MDQQEKQYGLAFSYLPNDFESLIKQVEQLLNDSNLKDNWKIKREQLLSETIDVTQFWIWLIEHNSEDINKLINADNFWKQFR